MTEERKRLMTLLCEAHNIANNAKLFDDCTYAQQLGKEADHLLANGVTIPVKCDDCIHYEEPDEGDYLGVCCAGILAVSKNGEIYPGRGFYCLYGERKNDWKPLQEPPKGG